MSSERSVRVAGPESLPELVAPVRAVLGLPEGEFLDSSWSTTTTTTAVSIRHAPFAGYDYVVTVDDATVTDPQARRLRDFDHEARQVFHGLAATTGWALCLLDHVNEARATRPAVVPTI